MFETDTTKNYVQTRPEEVIDIHSSINRAMIAPEGRSTEPAQAFIASIYKEGAYEVYIFLHLTNLNEGILYSWDEGAAPAEQIPGIYRAALEFTESMGFMMDDLKYRGKGPEEKVETFEEVPMFHADLSRFQEEAEEEEDESELLIESLEDEGEEEEAVNLDLLGEEEDVTPQEAEAEPESEEVSEIELDDSEVMLVGAEEDSEEESGSSEQAEQKLDEQALLDALGEDDSSIVEAEVESAAPSDEQTQEAPPPLESMVDNSSDSAPAQAEVEEELLTMEEESILGEIEESAPASESPASAGGEEEDISIEIEDEEEATVSPAPDSPSAEAMAEEVEEISFEPPAEGPPVEVQTEPEPAVPEPEPSPPPAPDVTSGAGAAQPAAPAAPAGRPQTAAANVNPEDSDEEMLVRFLAMM